MIQIRVLQSPHGYRAESSITPIVTHGATWHEALALLIRETPGRFGIKLTVEARQVSELRRPPVAEAVTAID